MKGGVARVCIARILENPPHAHMASTEETDTTENVCDHRGGKTYRWGNARGSGWKWDCCKAEAPGPSAPPTPQPSNGKMPASTSSSSCSTTHLTVPSHLENSTNPTTVESVDMLPTSCDSLARILGTLDLSAVPKTTGQGWVYLMVDTMKPGRVKVGTSISPFRRLNTFKTPNPDIFCCMMSPCRDGNSASTAEDLAHQYLARYRIEKTEWFQVDIKTAQLAILQAITVVQ